MSIVKGFCEEFGVSLEKKNYVNNCLTLLAYRFGYQEIQIPMLEFATSFDETVVGKSPWPEWNSKGIFSFQIANYHDSYDEKPEMQNVLLIPEGTTSVTRWLGDKINANDYSYPIKMFYNLTCYRNEIINQLSNTKKREFHQFGCEVLGTDCIQSDCEIISILFESLEFFKVKSSSIRIRINDISIYKKLCSESKISLDDSILLKENVDYLAECKAGKHPEESEETYNTIIENLKKYKLSDNVLKKWKLILDENSGKITDEMYRVFGADYYEVFDSLKTLQENFLKYNKNIFIDLCVIRSHEYYTGLSFEVDVICGDKQYIEIAGGGRFDRLVSSFVKEEGIIVPCTGFAFGTERLIAMLDDLNLLSNKRVLKMYYNFDNQDCYNFPKDDSVEEYFHLYNELRKNDSFNIYISYNKDGKRK